jgi:hypothetical protein
VPESGLLSDLDTLTMARVYLDQGKVGEAAAIFDRLVDRACGDGQRIVELRQIVERSLASAAAARRHAGEPPGDLPRCHGRDLVAVAPLGLGRILCAWEVTPRGRAAATTQLAGRPGALALRLVTATPGDAPDGAAGRTSQDLPLETEVGETLVATPRTGGFLCAAVGLLSVDGNFAPVAHSEVLPLPAMGLAASPGRITFIEVEPAAGGLDHEPPVPRLVAQ